MDREDELLRENQALRERLSQLGEASVGKTEGIGRDSMLEEELARACALVEARYGGIATIDESGQPVEFFSHGLTPEQRYGGGDMVQAEDLLLQLSRVQETLRLDDLASYSRSLGHTGDPPPYETLMVTPIRHGGSQVGSFFLATKEGGGKFSQEDEAIIESAASQAAPLVSDALKRRLVRRVKLDLESLMGICPVGVAVLDGRTGDPLSFNREAVRMLDSLRESDIQPDQFLKTVKVQRGEGQEVFLGELPMAQDFSSGKTVRAEEVVLKAPDGRSISAVMNATSIPSDADGVENLIVTLQDMTEIEEVERMRAEFLAMVSHELRTPLATVRGSVSTLLDRFSKMHPTEVHQFHRIIFEQSDRMSMLIADLLDVARIETGNLPVAPEPTDLAVLTGEAGSNFHISGNSHNLRVEIPSDLPWVMADRSRIVQVLDNLLTNAARHSPETSTIRVSAAPGDLHVSVSVSDDGRGIPAESLPHLFRKFSRLESEEQGGDTGLGLAVCKGIVEAHGGRIWAESDGPGLGATFTFTLPTVEESGYVSPASSPQLSTRPSRRSVREQVRILAVDDDLQALRYIRDALIEAGYTVIATSDPEDGLRLMEEERPHLVLLDLMLPGVDGIDLMKDIVAARDVPVIFVSAYGQDRLIARAFQMGADDYVVKPFSPTELVARIGASLRRRTMSEPQVPYVLGDLTINYAERLVTLAGKPINLAAIQYRLLVELSVNAGRVVTYEHLLRRVWGTDGDADVRPLRTSINVIRRQLGDAAANPTYIFTELRVGYRMPKSPGQVNPKEISEGTGQDA